jgi:hypothetical protein
MASQAQQLANAANAQLSTGPRTEAGKVHSAQNARKHGLTAAEFVIPFEDREEFEALHADYETDIRPQGALQQSIFEELVASAWNLRWIRRMETKLCSLANRHPSAHGVRNRNRRFAKRTQSPGTVSWIEIMQRLAA